MRVKVLAVATVMAALGVCGAADQAGSTIRVDAGRVMNRLSRLMYGSGMEDVNHEVSGWSPKRSDDHQKRQGAAPTQGDQIEYRHATPAPSPLHRSAAPTYGTGWG